MQNICKKTCKTYAKTCKKQQKAKKIKNMKKNLYKEQIKWYDIKRWNGNEFNKYLWNNVFLINWLNTGKVLISYFFIAWTNIQQVDKKHFTKALKSDIIHMSDVKKDNTQCIFDSKVRNAKSV